MQSLFEVYSYLSTLRFAILVSTERKMGYFLNFLMSFLQGKYEYEITWI